jgi:hypothetical protein
MAKPRPKRLEADSAIDNSGFGGRPLAPENRLTIRNIGESYTAILDNQLYDITKGQAKILEQLLASPGANSICISRRKDGATAETR